MADQLSELYQDLLTGSYDCIDRIVLNGNFGLCYSPGGFRTWWRQLHHGSEDALDNAHLMRIAGRFSRRVRGYAKANAIPIADCNSDDRQHQIAEEHLEKKPSARGTVHDSGRTRAGYRLGSSAVQTRGHPKPGIQTRLHQPLFLPHYGSRLGAYHFQDGRPSTLRSTDHAEWP